MVKARANSSCTSLAALWATRWIPASAGMTVVMVGVTEFGWGMEVGIPAFAAMTGGVGDGKGGGGMIEALDSSLLSE